MDSQWNRTLNFAGGPGRNLPGDLVNEFLNEEFKGRSLCHSLKMIHV